MINTKEYIYKKALKEIYELIKILPEDEKNKIPNSYIVNVEKNMDNGHFFIYDSNKKLSEQNFMNETKALIVDLYVKYFSKEEEHAKWEKYYEISKKMVEEKKREKYNPDSIFERNNISNIQSNDYEEEKALIEIKENRINLILNKIKNFIHSFIKRG